MPLPAQHCCVVRQCGDGGHTTSIKHYVPLHRVVGETHASPRLSRVLCGGPGTHPRFRRVVPGGVVPVERALFLGISHQFLDICRNGFHAAPLKTSLTSRESTVVQHGKSEHELLQRRMTGDPQAGAHVRQWRTHGLLLVVPLCRKRRVVRPVCLDLVDPVRRGPVVLCHFRLCEFADPMLCAPHAGLVEQPQSLL
jgi:hypothetical protein